MIEEKLFMQPMTAIKHFVMQLIVAEVDKYVYDLKEHTSSTHISLYLLVIWVRKVSLEAFKKCFEKFIVWGLYS